MRSLFLAFTLATGVAAAAPLSDDIPLEASHKGDTLRIWKRPCHQENQRGFSYAEYHWANGNTVKGCWVMWSSKVMVIFDDGDDMALPQEVFKLPAAKPAEQKSTL